MKHRRFILAVGLTVVLAIAIPMERSLGDGSSVLAPGDYAVYTMGDCFGAGAWFYSPFYGFEDAEDPADQIRVLARVCSVTLRWEVVDLVGRTAEIQVQMAGWGNEAYPGVYLSVHNDTWHPGNRDPVYLPILANLHAKHTVQVNLDTMDITLDSEYAGRWGFHVTPGEVATSRAEIIRNWYGGAGVSLPVRVTNTLPGEDAEGLRITYGIETFINIFGGGGPIPQGIHKYLSKGWGQRQQTIPIAGRYHDPDTFLLLVSYSWHYDDLLYHLYGILMLTDSGPFPGDTFGHFSFMHLVDTNLIDMPEPDAGNGDDGSGDDGEGPGDEGEGPGGGDEPRGDAGSEPVAFPWSPVVLFASVAVLTAVVAYLRLRPRRGSNDR